MIAALKGIDMNDIAWKRLAAALGLAVILQLVAFGLCLLVGIPDPYRAMINMPIGVATVYGFYATRKRKNSDNRPIRHSLE